MGAAGRIHIGQWQIEAVALEGAEDDPPVPRLVEVGLLEAAATAGRSVLAKRDQRIRKALAVLVTLPEGEGMTKRALFEALGVSAGKAGMGIVEDMRAKGWMVEGGFALTPSGRAAAQAAKDDEPNDDEDMFK